MYQVAPQSAAYNIFFAAHVRSNLDLAILRRSCQALINRHPVLRTIYAMRDGQPIQVVQAHREVDFEVVDASTWDAQRVAAWRFTETNRPFDLERGPVLRIKLLLRSTESHILVLTIHHIAVDFWSLDLLLDELRVLYTSEIHRRHRSLPAVSSQYVDHVRVEAGMLEGAEGERLWKFWREQLAGELPALNLPTDRQRPAVQTYAGTTYQFELDPALTAGLAELARTREVTLYTLLLAAFQVLLHRYSAQDDILVGSPMIGRTSAGLEGVVGYFANPVVLRTDLSGDPPFTAFLSRVRRTVLDALAHQDYPFATLVERLRPARDLSRPPIFQVSFAWDQPRRFIEQGLSDGVDEATPALPRTELDLETIAVGQGGAPFDLMLTLSPKRDSVPAVLQYNTDLFDEATIVRMAAHLDGLLHEIAARPGQRLSNFQLLTEAERQQVLVEWNDTKRAYSLDQCLHELLQAQVARTPDFVAVSFEDRTLTYRELNRRANQLARHLQTLDLGADALVGVCMERSLELVVALLGILKAGAAFLPLDPSFPKERLASILVDARVRVWMTQDHLSDRLPPSTAQLIRLDRDEEIWAGLSADDPVCTVTPDHLAYVLHTSGTTGGPKGVMNTHRGICNRLLWMQEAYQLTAVDRVLQKTPISFDVSVWEFFWPLLVGARLVMARPGGHKSSTYLGRTIVNEGITTIHFVPSMLRVFLADPDVQGCGSLKRILCSGETLPADLRDLCLARMGGADLHNLYGPTEAAIDVTSWPCERESADGFVSIGRPIANTQIYLLDSSLQPVPVGVPGELHIGGVGLARGYLNRPDLTAEKFIPNPFSDRPGARMYETGDLARYRPDGRIEFLGRLDHQVKIRGSRIEVEEIEAVLDQHDGVHQSVVVALDDSDGGKRLAAYLVPSDAQMPSATELRRFLARMLPDYMVPSIFVALPSLPLTPSGKVDRHALPAPGTARPQLEQGFVAPRNGVEARLASIWGRVLQIDRVGIHDNFFALGGASTQTLQVAALANEAGLRLTPESLFRYETVAELAAIYGGELVAAETEGWTATIASPSSPCPTTLAAPGPTDQIANGNTIIESLGVYLPPRALSTDEVLRACVKPVLMPLERLTGIRSRRVAEEGQFSIDLAAKAVTDCLAKSRYAPEDIDLLICCNISRCDGPDNQFYFEPSTSVRLRKRFGFENALAFDVTNACAGMFTAIKIADAYLGTGLIRCGMVVSGEYITPLMQTAQKEIDSFLDERLACLTLGDAGAAVILERSPRRDIGFHRLDMYSVSRYSSLCIAKVTDRPHGGAIMVTDAIKQTAVAVKHSVSHAAQVLKRAGWAPEEVRHLILHQTSETSINDAVLAINRSFNTTLAHPGNTICNLAERGNTATTTHFIAVHDNVLNDRIKSGDKVLFGITGSGQTIGTALYTFDDLPDRIRRMESTGDGPVKVRPRERHTFRPPPQGRRVRIESVSALSPEQTELNAVALAKAAARNCLARSSCDPSDLDLVIYAGVYRDDFVSEPAMATFVAGELEINDCPDPEHGKTTLAFDVMNGGLSFLNACDVAARLIAAKRCRNAMVVASAIENNAGDEPERLRGIAETGSAVILSESDNDRTGFGHFGFSYYTEYIDGLATYTRHDGRKTYLQIDKDPRMESYYLECILDSVQRLLDRERLQLSDISVIVPPQLSPAFPAALSARMGLGADRCVVVPHVTGDLFTSGLPMALTQAQGDSRIEAGKIGLMINVAAGIQVGCAVYYF